MQKVKNSKVSVFIKVLLLSVVLYGCSAQSKRNSKNNLAFELCAMYGLDQGIRNYDIKFNRSEIMPKIDSANFYRLITIIKENGYPNPKNVGKRNLKDQECVDLAAVAILLHNPHRVAKEDDVRNLLLQEVEKGNMKEETLLLIMDKYYWHISKGKKVYMGSKFGKPCIKDRAKSDSLRKAISLPPLKTEDFKNCEE